MNDEYEKNNSLAHMCGFAVVVGIGLEIVVAAIWWRGWETGLDIGAIALIGLGVLGEVVFAHKARIAGDKDMVDYEVRLAEADKARLELAAKLAPRSLSKEQYEILQTLKGKVPELIVTTPSNFEATVFGNEIARALAATDIKVRIGPQRIGMTWPNIYMVFPKPPVSTAWEEPLFEAFRKAGLSVGAGWRDQVPLGDLPRDVPVIMVGEKGVSYPELPPHAMQVQQDREPERMSDEQKW